MALESRSLSTSRWIHRSKREVCATARNGNSDVKNLDEEYVCSSLGSEVITVAGLQTAGYIILI